MDSLVLAPLDSIETHLNALVTSLSQTNTFATAPQLAKDLRADDDDLSSALALLQRHQQNYARILNLREEVATLQEQLKDTVRKCVTFKQEIGHINPSILDSDSDDEENEDEGHGSVAEVDYHTLLAFAARIGRHNSIAAKEAEAEAVRRKIASRSDPKATTTPNGLQHPGDSTLASAALDATAPTSTDLQNSTTETTAELERIDANIALQRAQMGMSFPDAPVLRVGALGQLQLYAEKQRQLLSSGGGGSREEDNEKSIVQAVEREVGRLVRESEDIAPAEEEEKDTQEGDEGTEFPESPVFAKRQPLATADRDGQGSAGGASTTARPPANQPPPEKKKLNLDLDFPDSDEEDD